MINSCGQKAGIWGLEVRTGQRRILARTDRDLGGPAMGPYSFDGAALAWALGVIEAAFPDPRGVVPQPCDLLLVDEIGKLELWHGTGLAPVLPRLVDGEAARSLVLVRESLLEELQASLGPVEQVVFEVDEGNRGTLAPDILAELL
jgi:nucleoside-triphosphatase THEP1